MNSQQTGKAQAGDRGIHWIGNAPNLITFPKRLYIVYLEPVKSCSDCLVSDSTC